ncbi:phosphotransferase [Saccharopolyspora sp. NPDC049357]|uniref:phosphotransferase n=1 Tax=Saccharopolyspora sp. NPDC049357 TaxID=3154507 RepID=UPI003438AC8E
MPLIAPGFLFSVVAQGWLVNGFERIYGRHADLSPGSVDLARVSAAINGFTAEGEHALPQPPEGVVPSLAEEWSQLAAWKRLAHQHSDLDRWERYHLHELIAWESLALPLIEGTALCHTSLHPHNILVGETTVRLVDWARSRRAAPFVDVAILIIELIAAGHTPEQAEGWAADLRSWQEASTNAVTGCAVMLLGIRRYRHHTHPRPHHARLIDAARAWVRHRMSTH